MSILAVGLSHHTAPVSLLERAAVPAERVGKLVEDVASAEHVAEAVVLSTCNRVEVYADVEKFHAGVAEVSDLLARHTGTPLEELTPHLYVHYEDRAVQHLFAVACGLDSMVVGESQILGQVRTALRVAQDHGGAGRAVNGLLQHALRVGKRAHAETGIDRAGASVLALGLDEVTEAIGPVAGRTALIVGAGSMSALAATTLHRAGGRVVVANRTLGHAERVAAAVGGRALPLSAVTEAIAEADLLISCTGATGAVITTDQVATAVAGRGDRPLAVLDLALPRDVEPGVRDLPGVTVVDLERLAEVVGGDSSVAADVDAVRRIVAEEVGAFAEARQAAVVAPTVVALRAMAADVVTGELARLDGRLPGLDDGARAEVAQAIRRVVDKLLHAPTVKVKELAGAPAAESYAEALRELFGLDQAAVDAVTRLDPTAELTADPPLPAEPRSPGDAR